LDEIEADRLVVTFDGKDFAQHSFQASGCALFRRHVELEEAIVGSRLHVGEGRHFDGIAEPTEVTGLLRFNHTMGRDGHGSSSSRGVKCARRFPFSGLWRSNRYALPAIAVGNMRTEPDQGGAGKQNRLLRADSFWLRVSGPGCCYVGSPPVPGRLPGLSLW